jgi:hypothetical protein
MSAVGRVGVTSTHPCPAKEFVMPVAAILANHVSVLAISAWAARERDGIRTVLGFPTAHTPASPRASASLPSSTGGRWTRYWLRRVLSQHGCASPSLPSRRTSGSSTGRSPWWSISRPMS